MDQMKFAETVSGLRKKKNLTQQELAGMLGVTNKAVSKWETGEGYPEITLLPGLAEALDVTVDFLMTGKEGNQKYYQRTEAEPAAKSVWADFASYVLLVLPLLAMPMAYVAETQWLVGYYSARSPYFLSWMLFLLSWGLCLYFRGWCYPKLARAKQGSTPWCNAYKVFALFCFFLFQLPVVDLGQRLQLLFTGDFYSIGGWPAQWGILAFYGVLYYIGLWLVTTYGIDRDAAFLPYRRSWLDYPSTKVVTAFNWLACIGGLVLLWMAAMAADATFLLVVCAATVIVYAIVFGKLLKRVQCKQRMLYALRNSLCLAAFFLCTLVPQRRLLWINTQTGQPVTPQAVSDVVKIKRIIKIEPPYEELLLVLAVIAGIVLLFEFFLYRKNKVRC